MTESRIYPRCCPRGLSVATAACCAALGLFSLGLPMAHAIQTGSNIDTTNPGTSGWNYVGSLNGASGVYLGDYNGTNWVLTAAHVGTGNFTLAGTTYDAVASSAFNIYNSDGSQADLTLFQIAGNPGLANLAIPSFNPAGTVQMIGFGGGLGESWGNNTIYAYANYSLSGYAYGGPGIVTLASGENGNGAQGIAGDSGGGMFYYTGSAWELLGTLSGAGDFTGLGNGTIAVDLPDYSGQIFTDIESVAIPEPSTWAALVGIGSFGFALFRRKRAAA